MDSAILAVIVILAGITLVAFARAFSNYNRWEPYVNPPSPLQVRFGTFLWRTVGFITIVAGLIWLVRSFA
jgi:hypothetical protein